MATKMQINNIYVYESAPSRMGEVFALRLVNDKIEEIYFDVKDRVEKRDEIELIVKKFPSITVLMPDKDIILRISDKGIRAMNPRRARGVQFETVNAVMAKVDLFGGVNSNVYVPMREIGVEHDHLISHVGMPGFITLLNKTEIDSVYEDRRRRREERQLNADGARQEKTNDTREQTKTKVIKPVEKGKNSKNAKGNKRPEANRTTDSRSDDIASRIENMAFDDASDGEELSLSAESSNNTTKQGKLIDANAQCSDWTKTTDENKNGNSNSKKEETKTMTTVNDLMTHASPTTKPSVLREVSVIEEPSSSGGDSDDEDTQCTMNT